MAFIFTPTPSLGLGEHFYTMWENGFTDEEINKIITLGDSLPKHNGVVGTLNTPIEDLETRNSTISWIELNNDSNWIFDRLAYIIQSLNAQYFRFNMHGFAENLQYTIYSGESKQHYDWHQDWGAQGAPRKLSLSMLLSNPEDFVGGDLEIFSGNQITTVPKKQGMCVVFPSFLFHRVTPLTSGIRKSLVVWACGEKFI
jgi:PKHD-type hydroxylase